MRSTLRSLILALLATAGCVDVPLEAAATTSTGALVSVQETSGCVALLAGQNIDVGTVCVAMDSQADTSSSCGPSSTGALLVTYTTTGGWTMTETQLAVSDAFADIPTNRSGAPKIGLFPYKSSSAEGVTTITVSVPLCELGLDASLTACDPVTVFFAAHAVVKRPTSSGTVQTETAWGAGSRFVDRGTWATYFSKTLVCSAPEPEVPETCETAWARDGGEADVPFCEIECLTESRWGWTNGPIGPGSYRFDLFAGGGGGNGCEPNAPTYAGVIDVEYDGSTATVQYVPMHGFRLDETHLYVGASPVPSTRRGCSVAPGSFPYAGAADGRYVVTGLSGGVFVAAHAVACGRF